MKIKLLNVRLSFPQLWVAKRIDEDDPNSKPAYSASFLLPPDHPQIGEIDELIDKLIIDAAASQPGKWLGKVTDKATRKVRDQTVEELIAQLRDDDRVCLHNGDNKAQYDGYAGNYYISSRAKNKPLVLDRITKRADGSPNILEEGDGRPFGGCFVNASIDIYAHIHKKGGKRVNASLLGVQYDHEGDAFAGGAPATPEDFDDLSVEEESALA